jgi:plasmid stabilization system protein ParE
MSYRLLILFEAEVDITDAAIWYHGQRAGLGEEFLDAIRVAAEKASSAPFKFPKVRRKPDVHRVLADPFPYRVFFIIRTDAVVVFRVLHAARRDRE